MLKRLPATKDDYHELSNIWLKSVKATHNFLSSKNQKDIQENLPEYFKQVKLSKWKIGNNIIGFSGTSDSDLSMLFLDPEYFRHGYGKEIISELIKSDNIKTVTVNEQNINALSFYQHQGFEIVSKSETDDDGRPYPILNLKLK